MRDKVRACIADNRLLEHGDSVIVALSGGADSVSLLHVLCTLKDEYDLTVSAAHFHHGIRGEEADRDADFVRDLCDAMGVALYTERADVPAIARESGESLETCGRRLRYAYFDDLSRRLSAKVATAHNLDDNTETVLMHLLRGSGIAGMGGIPVHRGNIIRPLLTCSRDEIEAYCRDNHLRYVTDSTNLDDLYTRNRLRHRVLPELRALNPSLDEAVSRMAQVMRDTDAYLKNISIEELNNCKNTYGYACDRLLRLSSPVLHYALRHVAEEAGASADYTHVALMADALSHGGSVDLGGGYRAVCAQGTLRVLGTGEGAEDFCVPFDRLGEIDCGLTVEKGTLREFGEKINKKFFIHLIPCDIITVDTVVRRRRAGDTFTDARRNHTKTVKKLLNELKIPREERDSLIVIARGSRVLWLQGVGTAKGVRPDPDRDLDRDVYLIQTH